MNWASAEDYAAPAGMVSVKPGDVLMVRGQRAIAVMVNDCRARMEPLDRQHNKVKTRFGQEVEFDSPGRTSDRCVHAELGDILERRGESGVREFLAARNAGRRKVGSMAETGNNNDEGKETGIDMAAKLRKLKGETKRKARGGLAADMAADAGKSGAPGGRPKATRPDAKSARRQFMEAMFDGTFTKREIAAATVAKFGGDPEKVLKLANDVPFYMRKKGLDPKWKAEAPAAKPE